MTTNRRHRRSISRALLTAAAGGVLCAAGLHAPAAAARTGDAPDAAGAGVSARFIGTLGTRPATAGSESRAGIKVGMVEIEWRDFETRPGVFSATYRDLIAARIHAMRSAGMRVTLGLGLQFAPGWLLAMPDSRLVDEHGHRSTGANLIFNRRLRAQAATYIARVGAVFDLSSFWAARVTSGTSSEAVYPLTNTYWAFDRSAQNGPDMPVGMTRNPAPGWRPGSAGLTTARTKRWETWYVGALDNAVEWQMRQLTAHGFGGYFQIVTPGLGVTPNKVTNAIAERLPDGTLGTGGAWAQFYAGLAYRKNVVAYVSSVGDGSGGDDRCAATDDSIALTSPVVAWWSATRWISRVAHANGLSKAGEVPGYSRSASTARHYRSRGSRGLMAVAERQSVSCGFQGLYWAHDDQFHTSTRVLPISAFTHFAPPRAREPGWAPAG